MAEVPRSAEERAAVRSGLLRQAKAACAAGAVAELRGWATAARPCRCRCAVAVAGRPCQYGALAHTGALWQLTATATHRNATLQPRPPLLTHAAVSMPLPCLLQAGTLRRSAFCWSASTSARGASWRTRAWMRTRPQVRLR